jgi:hypothetical protein
MLFQTFCWWYRSQKVQIWGSVYSAEAHWLAWAHSGTQRWAQLHVRWLYQDCCLVFYCQGCWGLNVVCEVNMHQLGCGQCMGRQCVQILPNLHENLSPNGIAGPQTGWHYASAMQIWRLRVSQESYVSCPWWSVSLGRVSPWRQRDRKKNAVACHRLCKTFISLLWQTLPISITKN